jgi:hypothetical protein
MHTSCRTSVLLGTWRGVFWGIMGAGPTLQVWPPARTTCGGACAPGAKQGEAARAHARRRLCCGRQARKRAWSERWPDNCVACDPPRWAVCSDAATPGALRRARSSAHCQHASQALALCCTRPASTPAGLQAAHLCCSVAGPWQWRWKVPGPGVAARLARGWQRPAHGRAAELVCATGQAARLLQRACLHARTRWSVRARPDRCRQRGLSAERGGHALGSARCMLPLHAARPPARSRSHCAMRPASQRVPPGRQA